MDLHGLSRGRTMLIVRGAIAFCFGIIASNQPGITADALVTLFGLWALAEGAATVRQAYIRVDSSKRVEARPLLIVLGVVGMLAGVLALVGLGLSAGTLIWVLAAWLAVRVVFELLAAYAAATTRIRVLLGLSAALDAVLIALLATHTSGSVLDLALIGGGIASLWGAFHIAVGLSVARVLVYTAAGPRLLEAR